MIKRKFKEFKEKYSDIFGALAFAIWMMLASCAIVIWTYEAVSIKIKITLFNVFIFYTILGWRKIAKLVDAGNAEMLEEKKLLLEQLKCEYASYISLVDNEVNKTLKELNLKQELITVSTGYDYLITFNKYKKWICSNRIVGTPDSFIMASCLMYALLENRIVVILNKYGSDEVKNIELAINMEIAMNCVFAIISEPSTYYENEPEWIEEKHPKVEITIPKGLIKDSDLDTRIKNAIQRDYLEGKISIMQTSHMLHLIYLNCLRK